MSQALDEGHDALLLDLDGTLYRGGTAIPGAEDAVSRVRANGGTLRYVTNNASKPPEAVVEKLNSLSIPATLTEVSTSAQAGAALLAERIEQGASVLVLGTAALADELAALGLRPVREAETGPSAVLQGHSESTSWADLAEACLAIRAGADWVACNRDATLPTERGQLPGNGALVHALEMATGRTPEVAGKPERPLVDRAADSAGAINPLFVGDRLETDIAGARRAGMASLLVFTGVSGPRELLAAPEGQRPEHVAADLTALSAPAEESVVAEQSAWNVEVDATGLTLTTVGEFAAEPEALGGGALSALRALCAAWWRVSSGDDVRVRAGDDVAKSVLHGLGMQD
ncbi:HAD-IIA family hydrolase [Actinopolyspora saharensis]|uniref:Haloacid Dehalogenase Superfamily Class (Subfamily) IIA n=1 Tax=Actinopolyspora saharensis TaxID=995062 RepID=A0A1H1A244_9ACTN|nr:HAD-IIA family hydrolase [Actinopolyspora saharensis]SDQ33571.1 Haloacid Dehalogenase Superfamily Class (subfamily) IIA [Actinopolyspora saharensis]